MYQWKDGGRFAAPAQEVGERLEQIRARHDDDLSAEAVVDDARDPTSPLHPCFDWDDTTAAEAHRRAQARAIIRSVRVVNPGEFRPQRTPVYVSVGSATAGSRYVTTARAMSDDDLRRRVMSEARGQLRAWKARYGHLREFAVVVCAIDAGQAGEDAA